MVRGFAVADSKRGWTSPSSPPRRTRQPVVRHGFAYVPRRLDQFFLWTYGRRNFLRAGMRAFSSPGFGLACVQGLTDLRVETRSTRRTCCIGLQPQCVGRIQWSLRGRGRITLVLGRPGELFPRPLYRCKTLTRTRTLTTLNYPSPHPIVLAIAHTYSLDNPNFSRQATARREPTLAGGRRLP